MRIVIGRQILWSGQFRKRSNALGYAGVSTPLTGGGKCLLVNVERESEKLKRENFSMANCLKYRNTHKTKCDNSAMLYFFLLASIADYL